MKKKTQFRQGDVLIERVSKIPDDAKKQAGIGGRIILAYGEATGHHHSIDINDADLWKTAFDQFISVEKKAVLVHGPCNPPEHDLIRLTKGEFIVIPQREYVPKELPRKVTD
jgi:hypothetical protein